jgi:hypothetical protein
MTTRDELDNRMQADAYLTSKGVLSPQRRSASGDAALEGAARASEEGMRLGVSMIFVPGQGWRPDTDGILEALVVGKSAAKPR